MPVYALNDLMPQLPDAGRYWVAPDAHVIGRVTLGLDVGVWFGAVIRGCAEGRAEGEREPLRRSST